jgi:hypothetical protein
VTNDAKKSKFRMSEKVMWMAQHLEAHFNGSQQSVDNASYLPPEDTYTKMVINLPTQKKKKASNLTKINFDD